VVAGSRSGSRRVVVPRRDRGPILLRDRDRDRGGRMLLVGRARGVEAARDRNDCASRDPSPVSSP
jgi:hypothetical protein